MTYFSRGAISQLYKLDVFTDKQHKKNITESNEKFVYVSQSKKTNL